MLNEQLSRHRIRPRSVPHLLAVAGTALTLSMRNEGPPVKAYVINLVRAPERREHMKAELEKAAISFQFIEAIDGKAIDVDDSQVVSSEWLGRSPFWPNVAGCALSHMSAYRQVLEEGLDVALVLEDDVLLPQDLGPLCQSIAPKMSESEVVLLHFHSEEPSRLSKQGISPLPGGRSLAYPVDIDQIGSAGAYLITAKAAERMAAAVQPVRVPADEWSYFYHQGVVTSFRCVAPVPVRKAAAFRSTIGYHNSGSWKAMLGETSERIRIPAFQSVLSRRRQRIHDQWSKVQMVETASPIQPTGLGTA